MTRFLKIIGLILLATASARAAATLVVQPSLPGFTTWTLSQISSGPEIDVTNVSGAGGSLGLPVSMFTPEVLAGPNLLGDFNHVFASILEVYSQQTFLLDGANIGSLFPALEFDHPFNLPNGSRSVRFELSATLPSDLNLDYSLFISGVHTTETILGTLSVTVIPEPALSSISFIAALGLLRRRR